MKDSARKTFAQAFEDKLKGTFKHRSLGRNVSYKHLVKLECYKLSKHLLGIEEYRPFKMNWLSPRQRPSVPKGRKCI